MKRSSADWRKRNSPPGYRIPLSAWQRFVDFLTPKVYADCQCGTCSPVLGCSCCCYACHLNTCCGGASQYMSCQQTSPAGYWNCGFYQGCPAECGNPPCPWLWGPCNPDFGCDCECSCCVMRVSGWGNCSSFNAGCTCGSQTCANYPPDCGDCWTSFGSC